MGDGAADERQACVVPRLEHRNQAIASLPIPDELMVEIFLRLPSPADLARASATCVSFRRVTADRSFLRRYRKLHAPPLLGFLDGLNLDFYPASPPYPSASAASAAALAADFSFSFLPASAAHHHHWCAQDIRDGRVLLRSSRCYLAQPDIFRKLVVCDPLHRRYLMLPPIPNDLAASVDLLWIGRTTNSTDIFLAPPCYGQEADETSFRVIWMAQCKTRLVAFFFASDTGQWQPISSRCWKDLSHGLPPLPLESLFASRYYVYGCFYWFTLDCEESKLLVLDTKTMEFSIAEPPPEAYNCFDFAMVEAGEGRPGMFVLAQSKTDLSYFIGGSSSQWHKVKTISLFHVQLIRDMDKYLLLRDPEQSCFRLDSKTFQLEKVCTIGPPYSPLPYSSFPPSLLSSPTISTDIREDAEKPMLEQEPEVL